MSRGEGEFQWSSVLCCPTCREDLDAVGGGVVCSKCGDHFEIRDSIPILLPHGYRTTQVRQQQMVFDGEAMRRGSANGRGALKLDPWMQSYVERLGEVIGPLDDVEVAVEVGTGSGWMVFALASAGVKVIGCDVSIVSLERLSVNLERVGLRKSVVLVCGVANALPIRGGIAELAVANAVLEHIEDDEAAARELVRVVSPSGFVMTTVPLAYGLLNPLFLLPNIIHDRRIGHLRRYTTCRLEKLFPVASVRAIFYSGHSRKAFAIILSALHFRVDMESVERYDRMRENQQMWSSNLIAIFQIKVGL